MMKHFTAGLAACLLMGPAFGQQFKGVALPVEVNTEYDETMPRLSPNDDRLYFVRDRHPGNVGGRGGLQDIWVSERKADGSWAAAVNLGAPLNNNLHNHVGAVTNGGRTVWVGNIYGSDPVPGISTSLYTSGTWSAPNPVFEHPLGKNAEGEISFYYHDKLDVLVAAYVAAPGSKEDLFVYLPSPSGGWQAPKSLGSQINTAGFEVGPFISQDGNTIYFSSNGRGGQGGGDIFMSKRLDDTWTNWSDPVNLGPAVNTAGFDGHFIMDHQGAYAYFVSGPTPTSLGDIYAIPIKDIPAMEPPAVVSTDTLRIFTEMNTPIPFSLDAYGVTPASAPLVSGKSIDGQGKVLIAKQEPYFTYAPAPGFVGAEMLRMTHCDPPASDNCNEIVVLATVSGDRPVTPPLAMVEAQTYKNKPVSLPVPEGLIRMADLPTTRGFNPKSKGTIKIDYQEGRDQMVYFPANNFVGKDTMFLYSPCTDKAPGDCQIARMIIDVLEPTVVVIDTVPVTVTPPPVVPKDILIAGKVTDEKTGQPLESAINIFDGSGKPMGTIQSKTDGTYSIRLPYAEKYNFAVDKKYYFPVTLTATPGQADAQGAVTQDIKLAPIPMEVGQTFVLKDIYFDLDKSTLKPESRTELQKLYQLMENNPTMEIEIRGHTDNWASEEYNITLSNNRSMAVVNYLKYMGVRSSRMTWKGFGESTPISTNDTDEGRALNRRVEFVITKI